jgi:hypothetical protein
VEAWRRVYVPLVAAMEKSAGAAGRYLLAAIPHIDDRVTEEVVVRLKSGWLEDDVVEIKKFFQMIRKV